MGTYVSSLFVTGLNGFMVIGPILGYIPQYRVINETHRSEGFSTLVSLVLLVANILRVFFWFGKKFHLVLLYQSVVMIIAQLLLLELCVRYKKQKAHSKIKYYIQNFLNDFWQWDDITSYFIVLIIFAISLVILSFIFISQPWFVEGMGFLALFVESTLALPQVYANYRNQSTAGLSFTLVVSWFIGDIFKTIYFIVTETPIQFILCGIVQLIIDIIVFLQISTYGENQVPKNSMI